MAPILTHFVVAILIAQAYCIPTSRKERSEAVLPDFVNTYDLGAQIANTQPEIDYEVVEGAPSPLTLDNLDSLNALNGSNIYLTSIESTTSNPQPEWLKGVVPDSTGKTNGAVSCSIVVNDYGNGTVDAFYMYFYAYNWGGKVIGLNFDDHVGDWEHTMTRFSNGEPQTIWYSQHGAGEAFEFSAVPTYADGVRPIVYSANGSHANYATSGTHDHTIPGLDLPVGVALVDYTDDGYMWDPTLSAYYASVSFASGTTTPVFAAYDSTTPVNWLNFVGKWGDEQYNSSYPGQYDVFGQYRYSGGPTGPEAKDLNRGEGTCPSGDSAPCIVLPAVTAGERM
ncbi:putative vacuolar protein sorting-associated protein [Lachnellula hyalina]|uniref:Putative vacuolar protein sorting-associated protein n=1 Tax=Lachnellula hyalina TaxID=1316788 RepID=A0A8H8R070_9HELO|nr:putative vacuolar protein sorting-associated protein [Lachnellula hyalina]TVY24499.1 putative vacuolar protein sorting-associated protein [Lachnellula hyalina]